MQPISRAHAYFRQARFLLSAPQRRDLPPDEGGEVAVLGRSNVGKSSVLNAMCDQHGLARTSRTPGRTQLMVVFDLGEGRRLLDLPGFGYAAVQRELRAQWDKTLPELLESRRCLRGLLLLADARHPLKSEELGLLRWAGQVGLPVLLALNKADKLNREAAHKALRAARETLRSFHIQVAPVLVSATTHEGIETLRAALHGWYGGDDSASDDAEPGKEE
jgi:GTP-binding protein